MKRESWRNLNWARWFELDLKLDRPSLVPTRLEVGSSFPGILLTGGVHLFLLGDNIVDMCVVLCFMWHLLFLISWPKCWALLHSLLSFKSLYGVLDHIEE